MSSIRLSELNAKLFVSQIEMGNDVYSALPEKTNNTINALIQYKIACEQEISRLERNEERLNQIIDMLLNEVDRLT